MVSFFSYFKTSLSAHISVRYSGTFPSQHWCLLFPQSTCSPHCPCINLRHQLRLKNLEKSLTSWHPHKKKSLPQNMLNRFHCLKTSGTGFTAIYLFTFLGTQLGLFLVEWWGTQLYYCISTQNLKQNQDELSGSQAQHQTGLNEKEARWPTHSEKDITFSDLSSVGYNFSFSFFL